MIDPSVARVKCVAAPRRYDSPLRREQARLTRKRVISAARDLFVEDGYATTTIARVAVAASVSQDTVYSAFGGKSGLLTAVVDVTLAGDDEPVPFAARPQAEAIEAARDTSAALRIYVAWAAATAARIAPVVLALRSGRGDTDVDAMLKQMDSQRLAGVTRLAAVVCSKTGTSLRPAQLRDRAFILASVETYDLAVNRLGWSLRRYTQWLGDALIAASPPGPCDKRSASGD